MAEKLGFLLPRADIRRRSSEAGCPRLYRWRSGQLRIPFPLALNLWRVVVDEKRTLQPIEIPLLIKIHRKRGMGWLIALDEPIFNKPTKTEKPAVPIPYYDYII